MADPFTYVRINAGGGETHYVNLAVIEGVQFAPATSEGVAAARIDYARADSDGAGVTWKITDPDSIARLREACEALELGGTP